MLPRAAIDLSSFDSPLAGAYATTQRVAVQERVQLRAGDARALAAVLGRLPNLARIEVACSAPFANPFNKGGHLQFHPDFGDEVGCFRVPTDADRQAALALPKERWSRWLEKMAGRHSSALGQTAFTVSRALSGRRQSCPADGDPLALWTFALMTAIRKDDAARPSGIRTAAFNRALKFIKDNCTRPLTVSEIASVARVSASHLHSVFRKMQGCTPLGYAAERRIALAERLLVETNLSVAEISERCGFAEQTSLTKSLKRHRGLTPMLLRRDQSPDRKP